ncbi:unnamed protein product (macronuclear) [Paramecium tetraurelia]|uniref:Uncharacterized protein n=1 Tax=Paramecium tetraurelia TaxID=5888 RepID=A0C3S7_PARTE|nr:uncharacterized protein GSPATT00034923001 [Paramecium tetraurelia]CAK65444.1 unnamed protein product [Paramecium tetraurelia]|eukprot:XP_001432841.1 hypothetical protein (macronuclear) [Paramecium tetraurelia strain d4-2]
MDTNGLEFNEQVNLLRSPPNFEFAENHRKAQIIHKEILRNSKRCPCCNQPIQTINYPLSTDIDIFIAHGTAYKYFLMIQIQFILLTINFIVAGIYNLIQNQKGYSCMNNETCKKTLNNYLSILNRMDSDQQYADNLLDSLYLVSIFIQLAFIRYLSYSEYDYHNLDHEIDDESAIKSCSMEILFFPSESSKKQIMNYFVNQQLEGEGVQFNIIDCCLIYDQEHLENQLKVKIREILAQNSDISLKDVLRTTVDQIFVLQNRELFLQFTGRVFLTLSNEVKILLSLIQELGHQIQKQNQEKLFNN